MFQSSGDAIITHTSNEEDFGLGLLFSQVSLTDTPSTLANSSVPQIATLPKNPISKETLIQIREDISSTKRPNWQANLPAQLGSPEHGKLKADQWRTALEFDIPASLIRINSNRRPSRSIDVDARFQQLVDLTLDLSAAISWGLSRRTSSHHADRYMFYMKRYLSGVQKLFPGYNLKPNHHYALHIPEILLSFGPIYGTWSFSIERLIGRLHKLNSNFKIGKIFCEL